MVLRASLVLTIVAGVSSAACAQQFTTIDAPGAHRTFANGINNRGQIIGTAQCLAVTTQNCVGFLYYGFLYYGGSFTPIKAPGSDDTQPHGINDSGQIVGGYTTDVSNYEHGFVYNGSGFSTIDPPGAISTYAAGINNKGQVVGTYQDELKGTHVFLYNGSGFSTIDVPGATHTSAAGINNNGQIVGSYSDASFVDHGFVYKNGSFSTIDPPGAILTIATGINDIGQVVGWYVDQSSGQHPFIYNGDSFSAINFPSGWDHPTPLGINSRGQIVGYYGDFSGFVYTPACQVNMCGSTSPSSLNGCVNLSFGPAGFPGSRPESPYTLASFTAPNSSTILNHAESCGFTNLNWQQVITTLPCPSPFGANGLPLTNYCPDGSLTAGPPLGGPAFYDPPRGGYTDPIIYLLQPPEYPFYYTDNDVLSPGYDCVLRGCPPYNFPFILSLDGNTLSFLDDPADPCLAGGSGAGCRGATSANTFLAFSTALVGVDTVSGPGSVSCGAGSLLYCTTLFSWTWQSSFNGSAGLTSQTSSLFPIDPGSGRGGVTITGINGIQLPPAVPSNRIATTASGLAYSRVTQTYNGTVTIKSNSGGAIGGPLQIVFFGMTGNVTLVNATSNLSGVPYITVPAVASLAPGQSVTVSVQFKNPSNAKINFTPVIYSGSIN